MICQFSYEYFYVQSKLFEWDQMFISQWKVKKEFLFPQMVSVFVISANHVINKCHFPFPS
jgi:hypothetical protein